MLNQIPCSLFLSLTHIETWPCQFPANISVEHSRNSNRQMPSNKARQIILYSDNEWKVFRQSDSADVSKPHKIQIRFHGVLHWSAQLRLTRPALHSSTIAGNYALSAPVKTLQCKYERGNVLLKVSKCYTQLHAQESRRTQPRMDTIWKDVQYERWRDITQTSCHSQHIQFFTSSLLSQAGTLIDRYESLWRAECSWVQFRNIILTTVL